LVGGASLPQVHGFFSVSGWGVVSEKSGTPNDELFVEITPLDGAAVMVEARKTRRDDVNAVFKHPEMGEVGFEALIDSADLHGRYTIGVVQKISNKYIDCRQDRVAIEAPN
jgi:hypothetical protein